MGDDLTGGDGGVSGHRGRARRCAGAVLGGPGAVSNRRACPTRRWPKAASGCAPRFTPSGSALPGKRLTVNLSPADLPKEGSHYDLPIALAVLSALGIMPPDFLQRYVVLGELALDGSIIGGGGRAACGDGRQWP